MDLEAYGIEGRSPWRDVEWTRHQRWVQARGAAVHVVDLGPRDAEEIVFVHGHSGAWQNWLEQLPVLAERYRVVAMDLPGFGRSPMPVNGVSISEYARVLDELLGELELDSATVVGNSMGGFIGAELAIAFPARVQRLVLVSAAGVAAKYMGFPVSVMGRTSEVTLRALAPLLTVPDRRVRRLVRRPGLRRAVLYGVATHPHRLSSELFYELLVASGRKPAAPAAAAAIARYDFRDRLDDVACPTLVVWGDSDRIVPPSSADEFERLLPDARKVIFEDTGHVPMLERPARFNRLLADFMEEAPNEDVDATSPAAA